ncbi:MAG: type III deoxyribonuclease, partial [bacterium]
IREGVYKSLQMTEEHFKYQYNNVPYKYFIYNSAKLSNVRQFATSNNIEIMIINIDAFKKSENIINQNNDKLSGDKAIDYIRNTNPIVIIDEPQSVDNTEKSREAIESLNPLAILRYSATHRESINTLYKLTPVDAYQNGLVKQISVSAHGIENDYNKAYIKLISVSNKDGFKAKIELDIANKKGEVSRKTKIIKQGDDLEVITNREIYKNYIVTGIDCTENFESIEFQNTEVIKLDYSIGGVSELYIKEQQIKETIRIHLNKELRLHKQGIKVLTLFFIDKVDKYRTQNGEKGVYAEIFEKCYKELINLEKYKKLREKLDNNINNIHNGYFSQDKKGAFKDTKGNTLADDDTYNLIMKDKEKLLSFQSSLRFIFSHSALKEGWDNPNVFQVCTLIEQKSIFTGRQKIGRGLRLCVNQYGERIEDKEINTLHIICNESFEEFAKNLQKEIEADTGFKFGVLQLSLFTGMRYEEIKILERPLENKEVEKVVELLKTKDINNIKDMDLSSESEPVQQIISNIIEDIGKNNNINQDNDVPELEHKEQEAYTQKININLDYISKYNYKEKITETKELTNGDAQELIEHFKKQDYIKLDGTIKDTLKNAIKHNNLDLPAKYENARELVENIIINHSNSGNQYIKNASEEVTIKLKEDVLISEKFIKLWEKIKYKTAYQVNFNKDELINKCVQDFQKIETIEKPKFITKTADMHMKDYSIELEEKSINILNLDDNNFNLPDILSVISEKSLMQKKDIAQILKLSKNLDLLSINPQIFVEKATEIITSHRHLMAIQGIKYYKLAEEEYYTQEVFGQKELIGVLDINTIPVKNSIYDHVKYDSSTIEKPFAKAVDNDENTEIFFKIPSSFIIETPIGSYNPDWAIYLKNDKEESMYFIIETKGSTSDFQLRESENLKIHCGKEHFKALNLEDNNLKLELATNWSKFKINKL